MALSAVGRLRANASRLPPPRRRHLDARCVVCGHWLANRPRAPTPSSCTVPSVHARPVRALRWPLPPREECHATAMLLCMRSLPVSSPLALPLYPTCSVPLFSTALTGETHGGFHCRHGFWAPPPQRCLPRGGTPPARLCDRASLRQRTRRLLARRAAAAALISPLAPPLVARPHTSSFPPCPSYTRRSTGWR